MCRHRREIKIQVLFYPLHIHNNNNDSESGLLSYHKEKLRKKEKSCFIKNESGCDEILLQNPIAPYKQDVIIILQ